MKMIWKIINDIRKDGPGNAGERPGRALRWTTDYDLFMLYGQGPGLPGPMPRNPESPNLETPINY